MIQNPPESMGMFSIGPVEALGQILWHACRVSQHEGLSGRWGMVPTTQGSASALHQAQCVPAGMHTAVLFPSCWETHGTGAVWEEPPESRARYSTLSEAIRS